MSLNLRILPLGGLGEIGMNAMVIAYGNDAVMVDCGVLFPDAEMPGVDVVIPDFTRLPLLGYKLHGYLITHGHEDHIGALPYALQAVAAPVYASRFTCGLVTGKLNEWGFSYDLHEVAPREKIELGPFKIEFLRVTHSIPDGLALAITTPLGTIIHTGDFKIDQTPVGGETTDLLRFAEYGESGVLALLSDSTNSERDGTSLSESTVGVGLEQTMRDVDGRIFVASFASHIHRLQQIIDISRRLGRKIVLNGRSMINNVRLARELKILTAPDDCFLPVDQAKDAWPQSITVLTTGSQAEPGSAMSKLATGDNHYLRVEAGDLVIFSSRSIPGNERSISKAINGLTRQGAKVAYSQVSKVHTSGHAHKEEQRIMLNLTKPRFFMPIHGELRHLKQHAETARECGIRNENIFVVEDGQPVEFTASGGDVVAHLGDIIEARKIMVDGKGVGDVGDVVLRDRQQLANNGIIICVVSIDSTTGEVTSGPDLVSRGIVHVEHSTELFDEAKTLVMTALNEHTREARRDQETTSELIRATLRRFFRKTLRTQAGGDSVGIVGLIGGGFDQTTTW